MKTAQPAVHQHQHREQRIHDQTQKRNKICTPIQECALHIQLSDHHPDHQHAHRSYGAADIPYGRRRDLRDPDPEDKEQQAGQDGENIRIQEILHIHMGFPADQRFSVGPHEKCLHHHERGAVEHHVLAQRGNHQRQDEVQGIGIDDRGRFHRRQLQRSAGQEIQEQIQHVKDHRSQNRQQEARQLLHGEFHLKGTDDGTGTDDVDIQLRQKAGVPLRKEIKMYRAKPHNHDQEHGDDLPGQQNTDFHN